MKSEERHDLEENELAGWIYHVPALLSRYGSYILFAIALALLAYNGYNWYRNAQEAKIQQAWTELGTATGTRTENPPQKLQSLINQYDVRPVQALAYVSLGDFYLDAMTAGSAPDYSKVVVTPELAKQESQKAYEKVLNEYADQSLAVVRARLGLGRLYENIGQWDKAKAQYEMITAKDNPMANSAFAELAKYRLEHLQEWSRKVNFGPAATPATTATAPATTAPAK